MSEKYPVSYDVEIPPRPGAKGHYPFATMLVGGSFPVTPAETRRVRSAAYEYGINHKKKFSVRMTKHKKTGVRSYRCWRLE